MDHIWQSAAAFAARAHRHQVRKDGLTPYAAHPFRVALTVAAVFGCADDTTLAAALLHDTIEDTGTDYDELHEGFGRDVADAVAALTKNMALPEVDRERDYDARLARAAWRPVLIKLADCYDNLSEVADTASLRKVVEKCRRAIDVARSHAAERPDVARAVAALRALVSARAPGGG
jgi:(p)ppGpp synthase/HD superfamily hydrolase